MVTLHYIGGGNLATNYSTKRKPLTCRKLLINFITVLISSTPRHSPHDKQISKTLFEPVDFSAFISIYI